MWCHCNCKSLKVYFAGIHKVASLPLPPLVGGVGLPDQKDNGAHWKFEKSPKASVLYGPVEADHP